MNDVESKPAQSGTEVSTHELKYPPLCRRCQDLTARDVFGDIMYCGVMVEAMDAGQPVLSCPYFKAVT